MINSSFLTSGNIKGLSALNLDGNPLDHPPLEIVKQGIKAIQQYLRDGRNLSENEDEEEDNFIADVWASSDDESKEQQQKSRSPHLISSLKRPSLIFLRKSKYILP